MNVRFAEPMVVEDLSDTFFYHVTELPGYGVIDHPTSWDLRGRFRDYIGGLDISGKSFLDVGAGSGYNTFEAESTAHAR